MEKSKFLKFIIVILVFFLFSYFVAKNFNNIDFTDKIVFIPINGVIVSENSAGVFNENNINSNEIINYLNRANEDNTIKAIILEINSPGGTVIASKEVADKVKELNKPVVAWIREVGASGAYWVASASDAIVADPLSITGSIGVIGSYLEFEGLMEKYGVKYERLVTGKYKDTGSAYKSLTEEERKILQGKLDLIHKAFSDDVSKNRKIDLSEYSNGEFFLGVEAKEIGLIDYLGVSKELANIEKAKIVTFKQKKGFLSSLDKYLSKYSYIFGLGISNGFLIRDKFEINA